MTTGVLDFQKIEFGFSSAEKERAEKPGLLMNGYIDLKQAREAALAGPKYLFLGYKGSGKSAIGERIELESLESHDTFARLVSLQDFPFTPFSKIIRGDSEPETKYPIAWSWILLIYLLESFARDNGLKHHNMDAFQDAIEAFRRMGLAPTDEPAKIVRTSSRNSFKLALPGKIGEFEWAGSETRPAADIPNFVDSLKELVTGVRSVSQHYLILDGLDDVLTSRDVQSKSLGALIFEVERLNTLFNKASVPAKIIVLCRTDLFERMPGANKNKIRQDSAVELDWYHNPQEPESSLLVHVAQLRMMRSLEQPYDLFSKFFVPTTERQDTRTYLLEMTRHTPRDFLQLLAHMQEFATPGMLTENEIRAGMRSYSIKYFLPEIQDELSGYASTQEIAAFFRVVSRLRKRDFTFGELVAADRAMAKSLGEARLFEICDVLFECSGIGNIQHREGGRTFYTFKYRNRHSTFVETEGLMLHRGLWKSMNIV
jgi:hypothetical protein